VKSEKIGAWLLVSLHHWPLFIARPALDVYLFFWTGHFSGASGSGWPIKTRNFVLTDFAAAFIRALVFLKNSQSIVIIL
jgi:hypothetical protein